MIELKQVKVIFNEGTINERQALQGIDLTLNDGDFVTVIGSNGAGKSTLLNAIAGSVSLTAGSIINQGKEISHMKEYKRAQFIGRLFQDPLKGTAPSMTIEENLALAYGRGKKQRLGLGVRKKDEQVFKERLSRLGLGLEERLKQEVGYLSGGQRQALTLLMATMENPEILLLDEHTAALDPKTSLKIMEITDQIIKENHITTLMITHNIENALHYGNKTLVMNEGQILTVLEGEKRQSMSVQDVMALYSSAYAVLSDSTLLTR